MAGWWLGEGKDVRFFGCSVGKSERLLGGCRRAAGDFSALLAVDPLEEDIEQEVAAKDANRQKNREGHGGLARAGVNASPDKERVVPAWERSPERIVRNLLGRFVDGGRCRRGEEDSGGCRAYGVCDPKAESGDLRNRLKKMETNLPLARLGEKWETPLKMLWEMPWKSREIWFKGL